MENTACLNYSLYQNITKQCKKFDKLRKEVDIYKLHDYVFRKKASEYFVKKFKYIYNEIENNIYSQRDYILTLYYSLIFQKNVDLKKDLTRKNIRSVGAMFCKKQLISDKKFIILIHRKMKLKGGLNTFFDIQDDGESIVFKLVRRKCISPIFFIYYSKYFKHNEKETFEHLRFRKICNFIKTYLLEGLDNG
ncbi:MAG: hypothetical protein ACOC2U_02515 [bacterium]